MGDLRKPFFWLAVGLLAFVVLVELGANLLGGAVPSPAGFANSLPGDVADAVDDLDGEQRAALNLLRVGNKPPGLGIPYMALVDSLLLYTIGLIGAALIVPERLQGRVQGVVTLVFSFFGCLGGIVMIFTALGLTLLMIALLLAFPFGTIAYFARFGFFPREGAAAVLTLLLLLKLGAVASLVVAQQRFLQNTGLVLLLLTSILANVILAFLHGLVPRFLVSITDGVGAIIVAILGALWALFFLVGAVVAVLKVLRLDRALKTSG